MGNFFFLNPRFWKHVGKKKVPSDAAIALAAVVAEIFGQFDTIMEAEDVDALLDFIPFSRLYLRPSWSYVLSAIKRYCAKELEE